MDIVFWGAIVRMSQALLAACPTIVVGWLIAAIFERILGRDGTFQLFGGHTWRQLPQAWLLGMLLPVCSLGVIPIMVQMRRSGISGGTILAFGLTAPLFNPISVLYGLTLSDPFAIFVFCMGSLTIVAIMGVVWDWLFPGNWINAEALPKTPHGVRRIAATALSICEQAFSSSTWYLVLAIIGVGALSAVLPAGILQRAANKHDIMAPLTMAGVATLAYVTPMEAIVQVASMFQHGNSIGASFTLLVLGTGVNLGILCWIAIHYGIKRSLIWIVFLLLVVLAISYGVDGPLFPKGVEPADHTHAFDKYCNPFPESNGNMLDSSVRLIGDAWKPEEIVAGVVAIILMCIGGWLRYRDPKGTWMEKLVTVSDPSSVEKPKRDIVLPNWAIATVCLVGLVAASVGGCFLYYPHASEIRKEMAAIDAELFSACATQKWDEAEFWIPIQEDWAHKLTVSSYLRGMKLTRFQKTRMRVFLTKLEMLEHAVEDREIEEVDKWKREVSVSLTRLRKSFDPLQFAN